jgi:oxepin-CoA hydrolase/3-oxo-5,6-dehydrosuberyl-CoA semialdehyde dehydrogenase
MPQTLQSFIAGRWIGSGRRAAAQRPDQRRHLPHPRRPIDFDEAVTYARKTGIPALMQMNFQQRAARLKALALYLLSRKEELYAISHLTGATRADSWVDIEGGTGTLFAYASMGSRELPSSNVLHEGPAMALGRTAASPAPTSWCRAAGWRCTSTPSTSRSGACWKNSRRASWRPCRASASRPAPPAT